MLNPEIKRNVSRVATPDAVPEHFELYRGLQQAGSGWRLDGWSRNQQKWSFNEWVPIQYTYYKYIYIYLN